MKARKLASRHAQFRCHGFLYLMSNPAFKFVKLGRCQGSPLQRLHSLSKSSSVPFPYKLENAWMSDDEVADEYMAKQLLAGYWVSREFYDVGLDVAVEMIEHGIPGLRRYDPAEHARIICEFSALSPDEHENIKALLQ